MVHSALYVHHLVKDSFGPFRATGWSRVDRLFIVSQEPQEPFSFPALSISVLSTCLDCQYSVGIQHSSVLLVFFFAEFLFAGDLN